MRPAVRSKVGYVTYSYRVQVRVAYSRVLGTTLDASPPSRANVVRGIAGRLQQVLQADVPDADVTVAIDAADGGDR